MNGLMKKKTQKSAFIYSILVFILVLVISLGAVAWSITSLVKREQERADQIALSQVGNIQHIIENQLYTTHIAEALLKQGNGKIDDFEYIMKEIHADYTFESISLAPDGIVTRIYPYKGNEGAINHNLFTDPARRTEAIAARDSGKLTLSGPFTLKQGGFGAVGRLPVYLKDESGKEYFWGFTAVVLRFPKALNAAHMENLETQGYAYELWRTHPDTQERQVILQSEIPMNGTPQEESFSLPNSTWTLSLTMQDGWIDKNLLILRSAIALIFSVLASLLYKNILELARNRNELNISVCQQAANYQEMNQLNEELRVFRHDLKNHMLSLSSLLEKQDISQAREYIAALSETLTATTKIVNTENYIFDAILAEKLEKARARQIQVDREVLIGKQLNIKNSDWSILFGNALDNAIEACERVTDTTPRISIFIQYSGNILQTRISNTAAEKPTMSGKSLISTKNDPHNHGIGLKNIQAIVKKYNGVIETRYEDGIFTLSFLLFGV